MRIAGPAIVLAVRAHGEHGAVVRLLTPHDGLQPGYVRGGRSRRLRPVLQPGNLVEAEFRARTEAQLAALTVELTRSRAGLLAEPLPAAAIEWLTALTASALPEGQPYPRLYDALAAVLDAVEAAPSARGWMGALIRYELLALVELGYGGFDVAPPPADADWAVLLRAIDASGASLRDHIFADRRAWALDARERLVTRLRRLA